MCAPEDIPVRGECQYLMEQATGEPPNSSAQADSYVEHLLH